MSTWWLLAPGGFIAGLAGTMLLGLVVGSVTVEPADRRMRRRYELFGADVRHGTLPGAERHTDRHLGVVYPASRAGLVATLLFRGFLAAAGLLQIAIGAVMGLPNGIWIALAGALVLPFGAVPVVNLVVGAATGRRGVLLTPRGVYCRLGMSTWWLPWGSIITVAVAEDGGAAFLVTPHRVARTARWMRPMVRLYRSAVDAEFDLEIDDLLLTVPAEVLVEHIDTCRRDPARRARLDKPECPE